MDQREATAIHFMKSTEWEIHLLKSTEWEILICNLLGHVRNRFINTVEIFKRIIYLNQSKYIKD